MKSTILTSFNNFDFSNFKMPIITVYECPTDFEDKYVARLFDLQQPTPQCVVKNTLEELLAEIPDIRFTNIGRMHGDDPKIICVFI